MNKVAFVTYNTLGNRRLDNGWHVSRRSQDRQALVIQNTKGREVAADQDDRWSKAQAQAVRDEIIDIWGQLTQALDQLDHVVVYVGANGSEAAVQLAAQLPADKVTLVRCSCDLSRKDAYIERAGLGSSRRVLCACGGEDMMRALFETFLDSGQLS